MSVAVYCRTREEKTIPRSPVPDLRDEINAIH
jgi:hypothetical protein